MKGDNYGGYISVRDQFKAEWQIRYPSQPWDSSYCWIITFKEKL